jgi:hypothetical protein
MVAMELAHSESASHECHYDTGICHLNGPHGGVPDPDPATARLDGFTVVVVGYGGKLELRCDHYGMGCWWSSDLRSRGESLADLSAMARHHLEQDHRAVVNGELVSDAHRPEPV